MEDSHPTWTQAETRIYIDLYKQYSSLCNFGHRRETIFALISTKLAEKKINKTKIDCRTKYNSLVRTFKVVNKRSDTSTTKFPFYHDMKEVMEGSCNKIIDQKIKKEIEEFEKNNSKKKKKSNGTNSQIYYEWDHEETRMLIELYGKHKETSSNDSSVDWVQILIDLQNNGQCLEATDEDCRYHLHKNLREYLNINSSNSEGNQNDFEYYQDFENILESLEEIQTDLSDDEDTDESIIWSTKETFKLIELYKKHYQTFKSSNKSCWTYLAERLRQCGFEEKSADKIRRKFENLRRTYRSCISNGRENFNRFPFLDALKEIFEDSEYVWMDEKVPETYNAPWGNSETIDLIVTMKDFVTDQSVLPTSWPIISEILLKQGVTRSALDCEKRWTSLLRCYKLSLSKYLRTNILPRRSPYFIEMHNILSDCNNSKKKETRQRDDGESNSAEDEESKSAPWTDTEIKELIVVCKQFDEKGNDTGRVRWHKISNCLRKKGINKTPEECGRRWIHLFRKYRFCLLDKLFNENKETKFKYFNDIYQQFGDDSLLEYYNKKIEKSLSAEKIEQLIRLKHKYSKVNKSYTITDEQWNEISSILEFPLRTSILRTFYFVMFQKYKQVKKDLKFGDEVNWQYYEIFDSLYGVKLDLVADETLEEIVPMSIIAEPLAVTESSELDERFKFIAGNFSQICKFCLTICYPPSSLIELKNNQDLNMKIDDLFFPKKKRKRIDKNSDKICSKCAEKVEISYEFRNTVNESMSLLKQFSEKVVITSAMQEHQEIPVIQTDPLETLQTQNEGIRTIEFDEIIEKEEVEMEEEDVEDENLWEKVTDTKNEEEYLMPRRSWAKTCEICGKLVSNLRTHRFIHTDRTDRPFKCTFEGCNKSFPFNQRLQVHLKLHNPTKDFHCTVCGQSFVTGDSLIKHRVTHDKIMKYVCQVCGKKFYRQSTYKKHMTTHGIGFNHFCPICNKGFLWEGVMKQHMNVHSDNRPFTCTYCPKGFSTKRCLRNHINGKHPEDRLIHNPINQHQ